MGFLDKCKLRKASRQRDSQLADEFKLKRKETREEIIELGEIFRALLSDARYLKAKRVYVGLYESVKQELISAPISAESETKRVLLVAIQEIMGIPAEYSEALKEIEKAGERPDDVD